MTAPEVKHIEPENTQEPESCAVNLALKILNDSTGREATQISIDEVNMLAYYVMVANNKFNTIANMSAFKVMKTDQSKEVMQ